jgi:hypothetical protein
MISAMLHIVIYMQDIIRDLGKCLEESAGELKRQPDYLDLRAGRFNYKAGFAVTADPTYAKPSIILDNDMGPEYNLASSAVFAEYDFSSIL